jgi:hypothetical protein
MLTDEGGSNQVIVTVSADLLHHLLQFPEDARVTGLRQEMGVAGDVYRLRVESAEFPLTPEAHALPECDALYETHDGVTKFVAWKLRKGGMEFGSDEHRESLETALKAVTAFQEKRKREGN